MKRYAIYDPVTGGISRLVFCPEAYIEIQLREGEAFVEVDKEANDVDHYVLDGVVTPKPTFSIPMDAVVGVPISLSALPVATLALVRTPEGDELQELVGVDGVLELLFHDAGDYSVSLTPPVPLNPVASIVRVTHAA